MPRKLSEIFHVPPEKRSIRAQNRIEEGQISLGDTAWCVPLERDSVPDGEGFEMSPSLNANCQELKYKL